MAFNSLLRRPGDVGAKRGRVEALMRGHMTRHEVTRPYLMPSPGGLLKDFF